MGTPGSGGGNWLWSQLLTLAVPCPMSPHTSGVCALGLLGLHKPVSSIYRDMCPPSTQCRPWPSGPAPRTAHVRVGSTGFLGQAGTQDRALRFPIVPLRAAAHRKAQLGSLGEGLLLLCPKSQRTRCWATFPQWHVAAVGPQSVGLPGGAWVVVRGCTPMPCHASPSGTRGQVGKSLCPTESPAAQRATGQGLWRGSLGPWAAQR